MQFKSSKRLSEIENDSRKPNDNQPKRSLLRRLAAFLNDMVAEIIDALEL